MLLTIHKGVRALALLMAILAGVLLTAIILMVCTSILGRTGFTILNSTIVMGSFPDAARWLLAAGVGPIRGDYELLEFAMPLVIFGFLPWCQVTAGHASVDIFTDGLRPWAKRVLVAVIELVFAVVLVIVAIQLHDGMLTQARRRSTTFLLQFPVWWSYQAAVVPAVVAAGVACWMAFVRIVEVGLNRPLIATEQGAEH
jgi:TRAP-type C4-dicarboxylate transport system permease small subunit